MKTLFLIFLGFALNVHATEIEKRLSGDEAKAILTQLKKTGAKVENNVYTAADLLCQTATIVMISTRANGALITTKPLNTIRWEATGCSADPKISPSALDAFIRQENYRIFTARGDMIIDMEHEKYFRVIEISCYDQSDRCVMKYDDEK